jgi:two-component system response regulator AtoC
MKKTILLVDDEELIRKSLCKALSKQGYEVFAVDNGKEALRQYEDICPDLVLLDIILPDMNGFEILKEIKKIDKEALIVMITGDSGIKGAVEAVKLGAYDYVGKPINLEELKFTINKAFENLKLKREVKAIQETKRERYGFDKIIRKSQKMEELCDRAKKVAASNASIILIQGETGTGKELLAQAIHYHSSRRDKPFVIVNCTALSKELLESEFFGHEKGAFTGAIKLRIGRFEMADGGTIFLDEIGDVNIRLQSKLLRVIQERQFERVGSAKTISVDVRVIAATNHDLEVSVNDGRFREDLYYRLKVIPLYIPPLREREEDILVLAEDFIKEYNKEFRKNIRGISPEAAEILQNHVWKGNVRELKNIIEKTVLLESEEIIEAKDLPLDIKSSVKENEDFFENDELITLDKIEKYYVERVLEKTGGNKSKAARILGITRQRLKRKLNPTGVTT